MDGSRFDALTRSFGASRSRRDVLRVAGAGLLGALAGATRLRVAGAVDCQYRVPNPSYTPSSDGCGSGGIHVDGKFDGVDVTPACNNHDLCYGDCTNSKTGCDNAFLLEMRAICANARKGGTRNDCYANANLYYQAVHLGGGGAYSDTQAAACMCCDPGEKPCGDVCCAAGHCKNDVCSDCTGGKQLCGGTCVAACPVGFVRDHTCACVCPHGMTRCGNSCVDLTSDQHNCGACGHHCSTCRSGKCCAAHGAACTANADCCDGGCDPKSKTCCASLGSSCAGDASCCTQNGVTCGVHGACCLSANSFCNADGDCCGGHCDPVSGRCCSGPGGACSIQHDCCNLSNTTCGAGGVCCLGSGQSCAHNEDCCDGNCDPTTKTCCAGNGATCSAAGDCCGGSCAGGQCCTSHLKTCGADGDCCTSDGDICPDGVCCRNAGAACSTTGDCCFGHCNAGACCLDTGGFCGSDQECCSGSCGHDGTCVAACPVGQKLCPDNSCADCCAGSDCPSGNCLNGTCQPLPYTCAALFDYCDHGGHNTCICAQDLAGGELECIDANSCLLNNACPSCTTDADCGGEFCIRDNLGAGLCVNACPGR